MRLLFCCFFLEMTLDVFHHGRAVYIHLFAPQVHTCSSMPPGEQGWHETLIQEALHDSRGSGYGNNLSHHESRCGPLSTTTLTLSVKMSKSSLIMCVSQQLVMNDFLSPVRSDSMVVSEERCCVSGAVVNPVVLMTFKEAPTARKKTGAKNRRFPQGSRIKNNFL